MWAKEKCTPTASPFSSTVSSVPCPSLTLGPGRQRRGSEAGDSLTVGGWLRSARDLASYPLPAVLLNCVQSSLQDFCVYLTVGGGASWWGFQGSEIFRGCICWQGRLAELGRPCCGWDCFQQATF